MSKWLNGARDGAAGGRSRAGRKNSGGRSTNSSCNSGYRKGKKDLSDVQIIKNVLGLEENG